MDRRSLELLEFPQLRDRLAALTGFGPSRRLAEALEPTADRVVVARSLDETDEARSFLAERLSVGVGGAHDIEPAVGRATRGGRLEGRDLVGVLETLVGAARLAEALRDERRTLLRELGRQMQPLPHLRLRLETSLDPSGDLLDTASPALGGLRRAVRLAYERLRARLEQLVHGGELGSALQEPIITLRGGRYVVPVRSDARGRVKGIVHDQSGSGQTLFVEPLIAVELGNAWREAQLAVEAEEERILDELSELVATNGGSLRETLNALALFDFWAAKARLAAELDAVRAATSKTAEVELLSARHPGLSGRVVPIDIRLGGDYTALVITGPNTGGKTVALRTLGLLALMHQAGLFVPVAEGSRLPVFPDVFADIGDEQSVAQSLSTFSGHLRSIIRIVEQMTPGCLVLLDELGAGTDPTEGSALAQALLDHFIGRGALVVATSHYAELKVYAHGTAAARNASVEFDLETLSPTYRLTIGLPGTSRAFAIAERLGLRRELVEDARSRLGRAQQDFESTLASIKQAQSATAEAVDRANVAEVRAGEARRAAELERARARRERDEAFMSAREEAERALAGIREEIRRTREALARETITQSRLDALTAHLEGALEVLPTSPEEVLSMAPPTASPEWAVGMGARTRAGFAGTITALEREGTRAVLDAGAARVTVDTADLLPVDSAGAAAQPPGAGAPRSGWRGALAERGGRDQDGRDRAAAPGRRASPYTVTTTTSTTPAAVPASLDLRGARVDEALEIVERYLDAAARAGAERLTIIHGHGSGALRDAVRQLLASHPLVQGWRPGERGEGGDGATVVTV